MTLDANRLIEADIVMRSYCGYWDNLDVLVRLIFSPFGSQSFATKKNTFGRLKESNIGNTEYAIIGY